MERFDKDDARSNPHAYRGLTDAVQKDFVAAPQKRGWPAVKAALELSRDDAVTRAETVVDQVKNKLGAGA
jgi:hypothetical protein